MKVIEPSEQDIFDYKLALQSFEKYNGFGAIRIDDSINSFSYNRMKLDWVIEPHLWIMVKITKEDFTYLWEDIFKINSDERSSFKEAANSREFFIFIKAIKLRKIFKSFWVANFTLLFDKFQIYGGSIGYGSQSEVWCISHKLLSYRWEENAEEGCIMYNSFFDAAKSYQ